MSLVSMKDIKRYSPEEQAILKEAFKAFNNILPRAYKSIIKSPVLKAYIYMLCDKHIGADILNAFVIDTEVKYDGMDFYTCVENYGVDSPRVLKYFSAELKGGLYCSLDDPYGSQVAIGETTDRRLLINKMFADDLFIYLEDTKQYDVLYNDRNMVALIPGFKRLVDDYIVSIAKFIVTELNKGWANANLLVKYFDSVADVMYYLGCLKGKVVIKGNVVYAGGIPLFSINVISKGKYSFDLEDSDFLLDNFEDLKIRNSDLFK